ncbi:hypothetical protein ASPBRDRAFT_30846 [Aspergillus brasiliensis CBS 101740]|uniref:Uncharacterized protein n=1 Tax=Aspergillus brasiliensis (strain CBS 101740 / IMI 381727 / IBT 21946) TaxID=767769 RepID=A0A1L9UHE2_ASPBC|nr:hypothetical protein ASPBRDRAFT_30846 [Aspergillus brasiliensis CBS 101740]
MSIQDSDGESSISSQPRSKTPKHTFPLAHPPPKSSPCLRLTPRLLLQVQQLSTTTSKPIRQRVLPILEIYQPPRLGKSLPKCPRKLHSRDLYILQSDAYTSDITQPSSSSSSTNYPIAAGVIYNNTNTNTKKSTQQQGNTSTNPPEGTESTTTTSSNDEIYLPTTQQTWSATRTSRNGYRFILRQPKTSSHGETVVVEWRRKTKPTAPGAGAGGVPRRPRTASASASAASGSTDSDQNTLNTNTSTFSTTTENNNGNPCEEDNDPTISADANPRFVLCVSAIGAGATTTNAGAADQRVIRRSGLAGLEKKGVKVGGWDAKQVRFLEEVGLGVGEEVVTLILTLGVYVGWGEGWF